MWHHTPLLKHTHSRWNKFQSESQVVAAWGARWQWAQFWGGRLWGLPWCVFLFWKSIARPVLGRLVKVKVPVQKLSRCSHEPGSEESNAWVQRTCPGPLEARCGDLRIEELGNQLQITTGSIWQSRCPFRNSGRTAVNSVLGQAGQEWLALSAGMSPTPLLQGGLSLPIHPQQRGRPLFCP